MRTIKLLPALSVFGALAAVPHMAAGQAVSSPQPQAQQGIGEVIVTARRREERQQDVPVAITALSGEQLEERGVTKLEDLRFQAAAFQIQPSPYGDAVPAFQVRGQRQQEALITQDPSVGTYVDEVYQARPYGLNQAMLDLDNVQVLKGPQGTLFGRNTSGGALLVESKRPTDKFEGEASLGIGNYNSREGTAIVNLPVTGDFALRAAAKVDSHDGYVTNVTDGQRLGDETNATYRIGALFKRDGLESYTVFSSVRTTGTGVPYISQGFGPNAFTLAGVDPAAVAAANSAQARRGFYETSGDLQPDPLDVTTYGATNITTADLGWATIKNVFGYRQIKSEIGEEFDGSALAARNGLPFFNAVSFAREQQYSDELQVQGKLFGDRLSYVAGGYYFREAGSDYQQTVIGPFTLSEDQGGKAINRSTSLFAQADYKILDELTATAGFRSSWDSRDFTGQTYYTGFTPATAAIDFGGNPPPAACADGGTLPNGCKVKLPTYDKNVPTWTFGLSYKPLTETLLYATVSRGYRAGGYNLRGDLQGTGPLGSFGPFNPEIVLNYEGGIKQDLALGAIPVRLNLAGYHQDYSNIQRTIFAQFPGDTVAGAYVKNAAQATIDGAEAEISMRPLPGFGMTGFLGYVLAGYSNFTYVIAANPNGTGTRTIDGTAYPFAGTPKLQFGLNGRYEIPLEADRGSVALQASYYYQSKMYWADDGALNAVTRSYGLTDLRLDWLEIAGSKVDLDLYCRNLFDVRYKALGAEGYSTTGFISYIPGTPRTFGSKLTVHF